MQKKDNILHKLVLNKHGDFDKIYRNTEEESDSEKISIYLTEMKNLQEAYKSEAEEWEQQKNLLLEQNDEFKNEIEKLKLQFDVYEQSAKILEEGEDEIRKAYVIKTKEYVEASGEVLIANRKVIALQQLLNNEITKAYQDKKESIKNESYLSKSLADSNKHNKILEQEISILQSNLFNTVSSTIYNEMKEKHEELNIRFRNLTENNLMLENDNEIQYLRKELELLKQEKNQLIDHLQKEIDCKNDQDLMEKLKEAQANELLEKQRADHVTSLHEILQTQLSKCE